MSLLSPDTPFIPVGQDTRPACEWVMPAPMLGRRDYFRTCKALPAGVPDYLSVSIEQSEEGTGRCTAAIYGSRAYVIHYAFARHD